MFCFAYKFQVNEFIHVNTRQLHKTWRMPERGENIEKPVLRCHNIRVMVLYEKMR